ncbi:hypothetical protein KKG22_04660 [Patescibacteria group bacterium]|nr:hypothetical protein [Patescibacteria group bacterium]MBU1721628.1 hypothetical protein [Patescibacteria group bacterium]MBU1901710.1 hypothetical protein [Patescibacteria group bacterium]
MQDFLTFINTEHKRLLAYYQVDEGGKQVLDFPMVAKITEELGELSQEVLRSHGYQRKEKLAKESGALADEFADVLITTCLLAKNMDIDIVSALERKMDKIAERVY